MAPSFVDDFSVLMPICYHIGSGMTYLSFFAEEIDPLFGGNV